MNINVVRFTLVLNIGNFSNVFLAVQQVGECSCSRNHDTPDENRFEDNADDNSSPFVVWKWSCFKRVHLLDGHCSVSRQCQSKKDPNRYATHHLIKYLLKFKLCK